MAAIIKAEYAAFEELEDQTVIIYNEVTQETHFLNAVAGLVFRLCDGRTDDEVFIDFKGHFSEDTGVSDDEMRNDFDITVADFVGKSVLFRKEAS